MNVLDMDMEALHFIVFHIQDKGFAPSQVELGKHMGYRALRASQHRLERLEARKLIERVPGIARGLRVTDHGQTTLRAHLGVPA